MCRCVCVRERERSRAGVAGGFQRVLPVQNSPFIILTWWVYFASDRERGEEQHYRDN